MAIKALEQELILDKIRSEIMDTGAYEQETKGKTEFLNGINYCLSIIDKYKAERINKKWQEPCEDCISRQAVLEKAIYVPIAKVATEDKVIYRKIIFADDIENLDSVNPQPKIGHWIDDMSLGYHVSICSNCNWRGHGDTCLVYKPKYCPNCGCRMVETQEAEEKKADREECGMQFNTLKQELSKKIKLMSEKDFNNFIIELKRVYYKAHKKYRHTESEDRG